MKGIQSTRYVVKSMPSRRGAARFSLEVCSIVVTPCPLPPYGVNYGYTLWTVSNLTYSAAENKCRSEGGGQLGFYYWDTDIGVATNSTGKLNPCNFLSSESNKQLIKNRIKKYDVQYIQSREIPTGWALFTMQRWKSTCGRTGHPWIVVMVHVTGRIHRTRQLQMVARMYAIDWPLTPLTQHGGSKWLLATLLLMEQAVEVR